jgi:hypothetical protein
MTPHAISEFCIAAGTGLVSYLCMTQIVGVDPLPVVSGGVGTFIAMSVRDEPTQGWQSVKTMLIGMALAAVGGVFFTTLAHGWWPSMNGIALALFVGFVIGFLSVGNLKEISRNAGGFIGDWLKRKSGGQ